MTDIFLTFFSPITNSVGPLSLFPSLFVFSSLAPTLLRITVAFILVGIGYKTVRVGGGSTFVGIVEILASLLILAGFLTQLGVIIALITIISIVVKNSRNYNRPEYFMGYNFLLIVILLSLLITGPGAFALDLPL